MTPAEKLLKQMAEFPLTKEFDLDERGQIKSGSNAYGEKYAAYRLQEMAKEYFR